jgi:hypothetical protein
MSTKDQLLYSALHGTAMRYAAERRNLDEAIEELRQIADGRNDILAEAAGITTGSWYGSPATHVGYELIGAGMLILAGGGWGLPLERPEARHECRDTVSSKTVMVGGRSGGVLGLILGVAFSLFLRHGLVQKGEQTISIVLKPLRAQNNSLTATELDQAGRKLLAARHARAVDEDRDDADATLQGGFNLTTDEVRRVVEAPAAVLISDTYPASADHDEHYVTGPDVLVDDFHEIVTRLYGI